MMSSETPENKPSGKARIWILVSLCVFSVLLWCANWYLVSKFAGDEAKQGQFGDMFGSVNALFTALAFAGLIYTVLLQRDQLAIQQREIQESEKTQKQLAAEQIGAQQKLFDHQKAFHEEQRLKQVEHDLKLEGLRQEFEDIAERKRKERAEQEHKYFADNMLRAIRFELEALSSAYSNNSGKRLAQLVDGQIHDAFFVMTGSYFTVFESNAVHLGKVEGVTAKKIIEAYSLINLLVEEFRINNQYLAQRGQIQLELNTGAPDLMGKEKANHQALVQQAITLRNVDASVKTITNEVFEMLTARGIK